MKRTKGRPLCVRLREELLAQIEQSGDGDKLPTEVALAERVGVSRLTAHKVMNELQRDGFVLRRRGRGTFVSRGDRKVHTDGVRRVNGSVIVAYADWFSYDIWAKVEAAERLALHHGLFPVNYKITRETMYQKLPRLIDEYEDIRGIIVVPPGGAMSEKQIAGLDACGLPVVLLTAAPLFRARHVFTVCQDFQAIGRAAIDALHRAGHAKLAYLAMEPWNRAWQLQLQGMREALQDLGLQRASLTCPREHAKPWEDTPRRSHAMTASILRTHAPTGLIFDSFPTALAGARAVRETARGFADRVQFVITAPWAGMEHYLWPPPLVIASNIDEIVQRAFDIITNPLLQKERMVRVKPMVHVEGTNMKNISGKTGVVVAVLVIMLTFGVHADQAWNNGGGDYNWFNANNWSGHALPGNSDIVSISNNCSDVNPVVVATTTGVAKQVRLGYNAGDAGYLWVQSGGITNNSSNVHYIGNAGFGKLHASGGVFQPLGSIDFGGAAGGQGVGLIDGGSVYSTWDTIIGDAGTGRVTMTAGSLSLAGGRTLFIGNTNTGVGSLVLTNGVVTMPSTSKTYLGNFGQGSVDVEGGVFYGGYLYLGKVAGGTGTLFVGQGAVTGQNAFVVGDAGVGAVVQTGGVVGTINTGVTLGNAAGGTGAYTLSNGTLTCASHLILGNAAGGTGTCLVAGGTLAIIGTAQIQIGASGAGFFTQTGGVVNTVRDIDIGMNASGNGTCSLQGGALNPSWSLIVGASGTGSVTQTGGTLTPGTSLILGQNAGGVGSYMLSNGIVAHGSTSPMQIGASGMGVVTQSGGSVTVSRQVYLGRYAGGSGTYILHSGSFSAGTSAGIYIGDAGQGYFRQESDMADYSGLWIGNSAGGTGVLESVAGTLTMGTGQSIGIGNQGVGTWYVRGAAVTCGNAAGQTMTVRATTNAQGTLRGWGAFSFALSPRLVNNGQVIADGSGSNRDLDLSQFNGGPLWSNAVENVTSNGWYAVNRGRLLLASVPTVANNVAAWWGENQASDSDGSLDLVNSVAATFTGIPNSTGATNLTISLLAPDRTDVPAPNGAAANRTFIGVWNLALSKSFTSSELQFRYDNYAAGSQLLRLCRYDTGSATWVQVPTTALSGYRLDATGVTNLGLYAIAALSRTTVIEMR